MARGKCTFKQTDVTRAAKAALAAGLQVVRIEIDREGKIVLLTEKPGVQVHKKPELSGWEDV